MKPTIYLDLDGVCCDFNKAALAIFGREDLILHKDYSISKLMGLTDKEFWEEITKKKENFWRDLEEYPWFDEMYKELKKIGDVYFCSAPTLDPNCVKGKLMWLQDRLGFNFKNYIFIGDKFLLARKDNFLIDDFEDQCKKFGDHGGKIVLFPQEWNKNRDINNRLEFVLSSIQNRIKQ